MTTITLPAVRRHRAYTSNGEVGRRLAAAQRLQSQIQDLEEELSKHREFFLNHMVAKDLHVISTGDFTVQRKRRHNWTYSPECEREILALRSRQRWEQSQGVALDSPRDYVALTTEKTK